MRRKKRPEIQQRARGKEQGAEKRRVDERSELIPGTREASMGDRAGMIDRLKRQKTKDISHK